MDIDFHNRTLKVLGKGRKERMIPYLPDQVIKEINLEAGTMRVDWDPEF